MLYSYSNNDLTNGAAPLVVKQRQVGLQSLQNGVGILGACLKSFVSILSMILLPGIVGWFAWSSWSGNGYVENSANFGFNLGFLLDGSSSDGGQPLAYCLLLPIFGIFYLWVLSPLWSIITPPAVGRKVLTSSTGEISGWAFQAPVGKPVSQGVRDWLITLGISIITFFISLSLFLNFDNSNPAFQFVLKLSEGSIDPINLGVYLGLDGLSLFFILLTTFLFPICILASHPAKIHNIKEYLTIMLFIEVLLILVFSLLDLFLFYITFEAILIPMFILITFWGSRSRKIRAAYQLFIYTLLGSVLMLLALFVLYSEMGSTDYIILLTWIGDNKGLFFDSCFKKELLFFLAFFASFAVKIPMLPFHIWLPEAHVEAPTTGSILLAGLLLKLGGYGFLRFSIPLFPNASVFFTPLIYSLSLFAIIYASLTTIRQVDLKKIIAYSSVAHMNFVTLGLFSLNFQGIEGALFLMLSHGIVSSALFAGVGVLYDRHHTRLIKYYSGLAASMPLFALFFFICILANFSFPGTSSFIGEFLVLVGVFQSSPPTAILAAIGMVLGAAYSIWLYNRLFFGNLSTKGISIIACAPPGHIGVLGIPASKDITRLEFFLFLPFIFLIFFMGLCPNFFLDTFHFYTYQLLELVL